MKYATLLLSALAFMILTSVHAQQVNRRDLCLSIPDLTTEQQQKITKLGVAHQKQMDQLRTQFHSETSAQLADQLKTQMNNEMQSHYRNVSAVLTPEQQSWYDQSCNANGIYSARASYGRGGGRGLGRGAGYGRGTGYRRGAGYGRDAGYGRGVGSGSFTRPCTPRGRSRGF